jgi:hypothetical protein
MQVGSSAGWMQDEIAETFKVDTAVNALNVVITSFKTKALPTI